MTRLIVVLGLAASAVGAALTAFLITEPFGRAFSLSLWLCVLGLLAALIAVGVRLLHARRPWIRVMASAPLLLTAVVVLTTAVVAVDPRCLFFRGLPPDPSAAEWQEDLEYLADQMVALHPNLFSLVSPERFDSAVAATRAKIPTLSDHQILMELFRVVALPNDAHTYPFIFYPVYDLHFFPIQAYWFDDGPYVVRAGRDYRQTIGSRIVGVSGVPIEELYGRFGPYMSAENEFGRLERWSGLPIAEWLKADGLSQDGRAVVNLERPGGERYDVRVKPIGLAPFGYWTYVRQVERTSSPAVSNDRREGFWFEYDPDTRALYFEFNTPQREWNGDTLTAVLAELDAFLDEHPCDRFIVDLRNNGGGDLVPAIDVADFIAGDERIDRRGRIFVLIGRRTFSAGVSTASMLRNSTNAIFIGEPTGQGPVYFAGPDIVTLPHSRLPVAVSTRQTVSTPLEPPPDRIAPDLYVGYTHDDFVAGRDPLRAAAMAYEAPPIREVRLPVSAFVHHAGRYRYSPHQAAEVTLTEGRLHLAIDDFMSMSTARLRTPLFARSVNIFATAIPGLRISFAERSRGAMNLIVEWEEGQRAIPRLSTNYKFPLELLGEGMIDSGVVAVLADSAHYASAVPGFETEINRLGYRYLRDGHSSDAIAVFQLNVALFPTSANTYDSLGEGYMVHGDTALAIANYRRSLALEPGNDNARRMLRTMGARE